MSRGHFSRSQEIAHLVADVRRMTPEQVMDTHGIQILANGQVYDATFEETYKNISEWAQASLEDEGSEFDDLDDKYSKYDDEDY